MDYEEESIRFIKTAFSLLRKYKSQSNHQNGYVGYYLGEDLSKGHILKITDQGRLALCKKEFGSDSNDVYQRVIAHTFCKKYNQITYIGRLLATYLENLQKDEKENSNESRND